MSRLEPLPRDAVPDLAPLFALAEQSMGVVPNSLLVIGRWPERVRAFGGLAAPVLAPRRLPARRTSPSCAGTTTRSRSWNGWP